jgi:uncharacterized membrane protein
MKLGNIIISGVVMLLLDSVYLSLNLSYFNQVFKKVQNSKIKMKYVGAILCYIALIFSINYFVIDKKGSVLDAFLLGLCIYAIYETTNYATLDTWPIKMVVMDSLWGGILFALTLFLTYQIKLYLKL